MDSLSIASIQSKISFQASISQSGASNSPIKQNTYTELAEAKQRIRMLRQEIADKEELAELSQNEMEIAKQREIEQKDEIQKIRSQLLKARLDQDEIDELRTKGRLRPSFLALIITLNIN